MAWEEKTRKKERKKKEILSLHGECIQCREVLLSFALRYSWWPFAVEFRGFYQRNSGKVMVVFLVSVARVAFGSFILVICCLPIDLIVSFSLVDLTGCCFTFSLYILFLYVTYPGFKSVCCWTMNERTQWRRFGGKVLKYASRCFSRYGREHYRPNSFVMIGTEQLKAYWTCFSAKCYTMFYKISQIKRRLRKKFVKWSVHYIYIVLCYHFIY